MKIFVVTPYFEEPIEWLRECHESVMRQTVPCTHVMIADGNPRPEIDNWPVAHIVLPQGARDTGGTPRAIGGLYAQGQRADAVAYLDGDNWYFDNHIARMIQCVRHGGAARGDSRPVILANSDQPRAQILRIGSGDRRLSNPARVFL
ncbi:MAG: glycosyltransferase family A protein [Alphaproteobacteria bacterium]|jgi:hypothetical protein|nr:glycosyltransferase family A protein [Alphaproteobacteria bacterium]